MQKFYIATGLENAANHKLLSMWLRRAGHEITYDWTRYGSVQHDPSLWEETAVKEARGVAEADIVVVLLPGGRGTHTELGMAIALQKQIVIVGSGAMAAEDRTCVFYHHSQVVEHLPERSNMFDTASDILHLFALGALPRPEWNAAQNLLMTHDGDRRYWLDFEDGGDARVVVERRAHELPPDSKWEELGYVRTPNAESARALAEHLAKFRP